MAHDWQTGLIDKAGTGMDWKLFGIYGCVAKCTYVLT